MTWAIWGALAFCLSALAGSLAVTALRGWRLARTIRATARLGRDAVAKVTASAAAAEEHAVSLGSGTERLSAATQRLRASLAELALIRAAAAEPRSLLASIRGVVPRK